MRKEMVGTSTIKRESRSSGNTHYALDYRPSGNAYYVGDHDMERDEREEEVT